MQSLRHATLRALAILGALGVIASIAAAQPEKPNDKSDARSKNLPARLNMSELEQEFTIMGRVIGASLDRDLEGWRAMGIGVSPFVPPVKWDYFPGLGVVFTVPVGFPLFEHPTATKRIGVKRRAASDEDLWKSISEGQAEASPTEPPGDRAPGAGEAPPSDRAGGPGEFNTPMPGFTMPLPLAPQVPYDAARVQKLRAVLRDDLARYGWRMEHLKAGERIMIVAESPGALPMPQMGPHLFGGPGPGMLNSRNANPPQPGFGPMAGPQAGQQPMGGPQAGRGPMGPPQGAPGMPMGQMGQPPGGMGGIGGVTGALWSGFAPPPADHYLIAVPKSALTKSLASDAIADKIEEYLY